MKANTKTEAAGLPGSDATGASVASAAPDAVPIRERWQIVWTGANGEEIRSPEYGLNSRADCEALLPGTRRVIGKRETRIERWLPSEEQEAFAYEVTSGKMTFAQALLDCALHGELTEQMACTWIEDPADLEAALRIIRTPDLHRKRDWATVAGFTTCAFCGEGPIESDAPDRMEQVRAHMLVCEKHPASALYRAAKVLAPGVACIGLQIGKGACGKPTCPACALHAAIEKAEGDPDA